MGTPNELSPEEIELWKPIGKLIMQRASAQHINLSTLARRVGYLSASSLAGLSDGSRRIPVERGRQIAMVLGLDPDKLVASFPVQVHAKHRWPRQKRGPGGNGSGSLFENAATGARFDLKAAEGEVPRPGAAPLLPQRPATLSDSSDGMTIGMRLDLLMEAVRGLPKADRQRLIALVELIEE